MKNRYKLFYLLILISIISIVLFSLIALYQLQKNIKMDKALISHASAIHIALKQAGNAELEILADINQPTQTDQKKELVRQFNQSLNRLIWNQAKPSLPALIPLERAIRQQSALMLVILNRALFYQKEWHSLISKQKRLLGENTGFFIDEYSLDPAVKPQDDERVWSAVKPRDDGVMKRQDDERSIDRVDLVRSKLQGFSYLSRRLLVQNNDYFNRYLFALLDHTQKNIVKLSCIVVILGIMWLLMFCLAFRLIWRDKCQKRTLYGQIDRDIDEDILPLYFQELPSPLFVSDENQRVVNANPAALTLTGYSKQELIAHRLSHFFLEESLDIPQEPKREDALKTGYLKIKQDIKIPISYRILPFFEKKQIYLIKTPAMVESIDSIDAVLKYDPLTKLPNRFQLLHDLKIAIKRASRHNRKIGLIDLKVNHLSDLEKQYGRYFVDEAVKKIVELIRFVIREEDLLFSFYSDEFICLVRDVESVDGVKIVNEKLIHQFKKVMIVLGVEIMIDIETKAVLYPDHGADVDQLFDRLNDRRYG